MYFIYRFLFKVKSYVETDGGNLVSKEGSDKEIFANDELSISSLKPESKDEMMLSINSDNTTDNTFVNQSEISASFELMTTDELKNRNSNELKIETEDAKLVDKEEEVFEAMIEKTENNNGDSVSNQVSPVSVSSNISVESVEEESKNTENLMIKKSQIDFVSSLKDYKKIDFKLRTKALKKILLLIRFE